MQKSYAHLDEGNQRDKISEYMNSCIDEKRKVYWRFDNKKLNVLNSV